MRVRLLVPRVLYLGPRAKRVEARPGGVFEISDALAERWIAEGRAEQTDAQADWVDEGERQVDDVEPDAPPSPADPIAGLSARKAVRCIAELSGEQLDLIPAEDDRKTVRAAIEARRTELGA